MRKVALPADWPTLDDLGRDLLGVSRWRIAISLTLPPAFFVGIFIAADLELWPVAVLFVAVMSFFTYGSISHDLVHRSLGLSQSLNDLFLSVIELLMLRSGTAYRLAHLNHHSAFPSQERDPEGEAAHGTWLAALRMGPLFIPRLWLWAWQTHSQHRTRLLLEALVAFGLIASALLAFITIHWISPLVYILLAWGGTWLFPFVTSWVPHSPRESRPLLQTRRFRGLIARFLAWDHLYHLEHHLFPAVPHHRWRDLATRLDPYLDSANIPVNRFHLSRLLPWLRNPKDCSAY